MEVSVIIPAFNASAYIGSAIRSVTAQTVPVAEIIVIDDGSTDDTGRCAKEAAPNVTLVRQENRGPSAARNRGLKLAQGELVAFLDADDVWLPNKIERQIERINLEDGVSGVATSFVICEETGCSGFACLLDSSQLQKYRPLDYLVSPKVVPSTLLIDRRVVGDVVFPEEIVGCEDWVFVSLVRIKGPLTGVDDVLVMRRRHAHQLTQQPGFFARTVVDRVQWIRNNWKLLGLDSEEATAYELWEAAANNVLDRLWTRDVHGFEVWRRELLDIWPPNKPVPERLLCRVYPLWLYRIKDSIDRLLT